MCSTRGLKKVLVAAIGGGGDVASAALISRILSRQGYSTILASIAWERYVVDPIPGPIRLEEFIKPLETGSHYLLVSGDSYVIRGGRILIPQAIRASRVLGEPVYIIDLYGGVEGYVKALREIMDKEGADLVLGVDVGGDSLASGSEDELWSPLADWMGLAALHRVKGILVIHSPGSDGELSQSYLLKRIDEIALKGGLLGVTSLCRQDAELLEKILEHVESEASRISLLALKGIRGTVPIRRGSRSVEVSLFNLMSFYLDASIVIESIEPAKKLLYTRSLEEARKILNELGIYTELDLEEDLNRLGIKPEELTGQLLLEVREKGRARLKR